MSVVSDRFRGTTEYIRVLAELVRVAECRGVTTFESLAVTLGLPVKGEHLSRDLEQLLAEITEDEVTRGRPMLNAEVIGASGRPDPEFFALARSLGRFTGPPAEEEQFWRLEIQRLYQTWRKPLPH